MVAHTADQYPERAGFDVKEWTPLGGWQSRHVPARGGR
jgi:hypothetical protein